MTGQRVAIAGKGGSGKTTFAATFARLAARRGRRALVIDGDSNPNVAMALGLPPGATPQAPVLSPSLLNRRLDRTTALTEPVRAVVERHAVRGPDGVDVVVMGHPGHAEEGCMCSAHAVVSGLLADVAHQPDHLVVVDMEASPEHFGRGTTRHADVIWLVLEPYFRSLETARRMARLASELPVHRVAVIANKIRNPDDDAAITEFCQRHDLAIDARLPWSDGVLDADAAERPVLDRAPTDPYVTAVRHLVNRTVVAPT